MSNNLHNNTQSNVFNNTHNNAVPIDYKSIVGSAEAWLMEEASGNIVGAVLGTSVTDQTGNVYEQGTGNYAPGITTAVGAGFALASHVVALDPGTGNFNIFVACSFSNSTGNQRIYGTTNIALGQPGFCLWSNGVSLVLEMLADDTTTQASASWAWAENATLDAAMTGGGVNTFEVRVNRSTNIASLYVNGAAVTESNEDISSIGSTNITGYRVGVGQEVRGSGLNLGVKGTIFFVRQKNTLT